MGAGAYVRAQRRAGNVCAGADGRCDVLVTCVDTCAGSHGDVLLTCAGVRGWTFRCQKFLESPPSGKKSV